MSTVMEPLFSSETLILDDPMKFDVDAPQQNVSDVEDSSFDPSVSSSYSSEEVMEEPYPIPVRTVGPCKMMEEQAVYDFTPDPSYPPKNKGQHMSLLAGPAQHQVKDFLIVPNNVLSLTLEPKEGDYIVVKLVCDKSVCSQREIFLTAVSAKYSKNSDDETEIPNLKITHLMTPGKTKGYKFAFTYTLYSDGKEVERLISTPFHLWSNVNQKGFPRSVRDKHISQRAKNNANKRRRLT